MKKLEIGVIFANDFNGAFFQTYINESEISTKLCVFWYPYCSVENTFKTPKVRKKAYSAYSSGKSAILHNKLLN